MGEDEGKKEEGNTLEVELEARGLDNDLGELRDIVTSIRLTRDEETARNKEEEGGGEKDEEDIVGNGAENRTTWRGMDERIEHGELWMKEWKREGERKVRGSTRSADTEYRY